MFLDLSKDFESKAFDSHFGSGSPCKGSVTSIIDLLTIFHTGSNMFWMVTSSANIDVNFGVPQGSILASLLFLLSVNPLVELPISNTASIGLFADDIIDWKPVSSYEDILALQCDVDIIVEGEKTRQLKLSM